MRWYNINLSFFHCTERVSGLALDSLCLFVTPLFPWNAPTSQPQTKVTTPQNHSGKMCIDNVPPFPPSSTPFKRHRLRRWKRKIKIFQCNSFNNFRKNSTSMQLLDGVKKKRRSSRNPEPFAQYSIK